MSAICFTAASWITSWSTIWNPITAGPFWRLPWHTQKQKIVASAQALKMLGQYFQVSMPERYITSDEKLVIDLGMHKLRFLKAPMVHWPEVTFTYDETEKPSFSPQMDSAHSVS